MKRNSLLLALLASVVLAGMAAAQAASKAAHPAQVSAVHTASVAAKPLACDPSTCGSQCPHRGAAASAVVVSAAKTQHAMNGRACPVSDPSACPANCPRSSAAVAVKTASR